MRIRRGPLFWGLLLIPLGAIPLLVRAGALDAAAFSDVGRFWPLILVGLGLAILLGRGRASIAGTVVVALTIGLLGGAALATGSLAVGGFTDCAAGPSQLSSTTAGGAFDEPATVRIELDCGTVDVVSADAGGGAWALDARYRIDPPIVSSSGSSLEIRSPERGSRRQEWSVTLPAEAIRQLDLDANAGSATVDLGGAGLERLTADVNAGDLRILAAGAAVSAIDVSVNAGRIRITLGGAASGSISANAGSMELCVPADAALRFDVEEQLTFGHDLGSSGLTQDGSVWSRAGSGATIQLDIEGNAANLTLDPEGGC